MMDLLSRKVGYFLTLYNIMRDKIGLPQDLVYSGSEILRLYPEIFSYCPQMSLRENLAHKQIGSKSAAVVFNSDLLLKNEWGQDIDAHDVIIRINFLSVKGIEKHAGSRTTIRVLGREWVFQESDEILIRTYNNIKYYHSDVRNFKGSKRFRECCLYISKNEEVNSAFSSLLQGTMTNGFRAVLIALSLCENVTVYGADMRNKRLKVGENTSHFFSRHELERVKRSVAEFDVEQDIGWYFRTIQDDHAVIISHCTLREEYFFYQLHPRVRFA